MRGWITVTLRKQGVKILVNTARLRAVMPDPMDPTHSIIAWDDSEDDVEEDLETIDRLMTFS